MIVKVQKVERAGEGKAQTTIKADVERFGAAIGTPILHAKHADKADVIPSSEVQVSSPSSSDFPEQSSNLHLLASVVCEGQHQL
jgi:hypothetical protein